MNFAPFAVGFWKLNAARVGTGGTHHKIVRIFTNRILTTREKIKRREVCPWEIIKSNYHYYLQ